MPWVNSLRARRKVKILAEPQTTQPHFFSHPPGTSLGACSPCWGPTLWQSGSLWWAGIGRCGWTWRPTRRRWFRRRRSGRWGPRAPQTLERVGKKKHRERRTGVWVVLSQSMCVTWWLDSVCLYIMSSNKNVLMLTVVSDGDKLYYWLMWVFMHRWYCLNATVYTNLVYFAWIWSIKNGPQIYNNGPVENTILKKQKTYCPPDLCCLGAEISQQKWWVNCHIGWQKWKQCTVYIHEQEE